MWVTPEVKKWKQKESYEVSLNSKLKKKVNN